MRYLFKIVLKDNIRLNWGTYFSTFVLYLGFVDFASITQDHFKVFPYGLFFCFSDSKIEKFSNYFVFNFPRLWGCDRTKNDSKGLRVSVTGGFSGELFGQENVKSPVRWWTIPSVIIFAAVEEKQSMTSAAAVSPITLVNNSVFAGNKGAHEVRTNGTCLERVALAIFSWFLDSVGPGSSLFELAIPWAVGGTLAVPRSLWGGLHRGLILCSLASEFI